jgi:hypothetical protein
MKKQKRTRKLFVVRGFDSFSHESFFIGRYSGLAEAKKVAKEHAGTMTLTYVYHNGKMMFKAGSY